MGVHDAACAAARVGGIRGLFGAALIAGLVAAATVYALFQSGLVNWAAVAMFGPPRVVLAEAYEPIPDGPSFDHSGFDILLRKHVDPHTGLIDYAGLVVDEAELNAYIDSLAEAPFDVMGRNHRLALLLNAYNAFTLRLILDHYNDGGLVSIQDIPAERRWEDARWRVGRHTWSLDEIEHHQVREKFRDTRVHWALVCAARGCPPLRAEAYAPDRLDRQLEDQAERVHSSDAFVRYDARKRTVWLTSLYNWYAYDFEQVDGSVLASVALYVPEVREELELGRRPIVRWMDYDWSLNAAPRAATQP